MMMHTFRKNGLIVKMTIKDKNQFKRIGKDSFLSLL